MPKIKDPQNSTLYDFLKEHTVPDNTSYLLKYNSDHYTCTSIDDFQISYSRSLPISSFLYDVHVDSYEYTSAANPDQRDVYVLYLEPNAAVDETISTYGGLQKCSHNDKQE